jgi:hypothetical protein
LLSSSVAYVILMHSKMSSFAVLMLYLKLIAVILIELLVIYGLFGPSGMNEEAVPHIGRGGSNGPG